jgi:pullulanase
MHPARLLFLAPLLAFLSLSGAFAQPSSVTVAGSLQNELGCAGDWDPSCAATYMTLREGGIWRLTASVPAGSYEYKFALDGSWDENYGLGGAPSGEQIALSHGATASVRFYFRAPPPGGLRAEVADSVNQRIVTVPGSHQSEMGCAGDWAPDCLISWAGDADGDGVHRLQAALPPGNYEYKFAIDEAWNESYGGPGGATLPLVVAGDCPLVEFVFVSPDNSGTAYCALALFGDGFE